MKGPINTIQPKTAAPPTFCKQANYFIMSINQSVLELKRFFIIICITVCTRNVNRNLSLEALEIGIKSYRGSCSNIWRVAKMENLEYLLLSCNYHLKLCHEMIVRPFLASVLFGIQRVNKKYLFDKNIITIDAHQLTILPELYQSTSTRLLGNSFGTLTSGI